MWHDVVKVNDVDELFATTSSMQVRRFDREINCKTEAQERKTNLRIYSNM